MHHLPRFLNPNKHNNNNNHNSNSNSNSNSSSRRKPKKLDRKNAQKNIDYQPPSSSAATFFSDNSLDYSPPSITSFRVQGTDDGEIDSICEFLGLSGPDDLGIDLDAWESRKNKSTSQISVLGEPDVHTLINPTTNENTPATVFPGPHFEDRIACTVTEDNTPVPEGLFSKPGFKEVLDYRDRVGELGEEFSDVVRISDAKLSRGIKGSRPPALVAPPPVSGVRIVDDDCSTWDILRSLDGGGGGLVYEEDQGFDGENNGVVSGSCSFTTSIDDDCSSTTTDPQSNISPQGKLRWFISSGNWDRGKLLGQGSFGSVYEGIADDGTFFAVKEVSLLDQGDKGRQCISQLEQEISLLSKFKHENIVQYYGTKRNESTLYIFLELASKGSLYFLYQQYRLRDSQASAYTWQILQGLKYLHDQDVIHRDIKCGNILVDTHGTVKLADFGLAKATKLNDVKSCKGSPFWMAPEVVKRSEGYGLAADIWSLGCTVLEMLTGQLPYSPLDGMQALYQIGSCQPPPVPDSLSRDARNFILQCLQVDPSSRPTAANLLDHPFVKRQVPYPFVSASPQNPRRRL